MRRRLRAVLTTVVLMGLVLPRIAAAQEASVPPTGSIVYIDQHDVWLAAPDGSQRRRVTTDGTEADPYHDPSQADDGTIVVIKGEDALHRYGRDGRAIGDVVRLIALENGAEGLVLSPAGDRVAYATTGTGVEVDPRFGTPTGIYLYGGTDVATLDGKPVDDAVAPSMIFPHWFGADGLVVSDGVDLYTYHPGTSQPSVWVSFTSGCVTDFDCPRGREAYATISQPVVSRDGRLLAYTYSPFFGEAGRRIARMTAEPPAPAMTACLLAGQERSLTPLTFSPDGGMLAFDDAVFDPDLFEARPASGVFIMALDLDVEDCGLSASRMILPGGSQPEWGPAPP